MDVKRKPVLLLLMHESVKNTDTAQKKDSEQVLMKNVVNLEKKSCQSRFLSFLSKVKKPLVVVGTLLPKDRESVIESLLCLNAPVYLEGVSGIREEARLDPIKIVSIEKIWERSASFGYPIDGIIRIGGVPTLRPWRDLEAMENKILVCSISHLPFSGLSWAEVIHTDLSDFFGPQLLLKTFDKKLSSSWLNHEKESLKRLESLLFEESLSEPSLLFHLSKQIPKGATVYLGNSLPIREWDFAATYEPRELKVFASRGVNGIDGQVSTFLGIAKPEESNWGIFGDLTMLYDFAGPWILNQLENTQVNFVVINNGGGQIFSRMFPQKQFLNSHTLTFEHFAKHWGLCYVKKSFLPSDLNFSKNTLLELIPDADSTKRFWEKMQSANT